MLNQEILPTPNQFGPEKPGQKKKHAQKKRGVSAKGGGFLATSPRLGYEFRVPFAPASLGGQEFLLVKVVVVVNNHKGRHGVFPPIFLSLQKPFQSQEFGKKKYPDKKKLLSSGPLRFKGVAVSCNFLKILAGNLPSSMFEMLGYNEKE